MSIFSNLKDKVARNIGDKIDSVKLNFIDKTSGVLGYMLFSFIAIFLVLAVLLFIGLGLAETFTALFDSRIAGFFATAGVYILLLAILYAFRKNVTERFAGIFIKMLTQQEEDDEEKEKTDQ